MRCLRVITCRARCALSRLARAQELEYYLPKQVSVSGGNLVLTSDKQQYENYNYVSGMCVPRPVVDSSPAHARAKHDTPGA